MTTPTPDQTILEAADGTAKPRHAELNGVQMKSGCPSRDLLHIFPAIDLEMPCWLRIHQFLMIL
jgi:hypothetical protein